VNVYHTSYLDLEFACEVPGLQGTDNTTATPNTNSRWFRAFFRPAPETHMMYTAFSNSSLQGRSESGHLTDRQPEKVVESLVIGASSLVQGGDCQSVKEVENRTR
jgi:hypothetical protein